MHFVIFCEKDVVASETFDDAIHLPIEGDA